MDHTGETATFLAVGDVAPYRDDPGSIFDSARGFIRAADAAFCQLEITLSDKGHPLPQARLAMQSDWRTAEALAEAGFSVVSFASNHCMDWGPDAFFDTTSALESQDLLVVGAGANIDEARRPAIFDVRGNRIAVLAYNSILPHGYWAEADRPGCVPLRAHTLYEQVEHDQPGTPPRIHTFPLAEDRDKMIQDIRAVGSQADVVIVSFHWGIHFIPAVIADYQRELACAAIDNGADLIIGHHPHILKGAEVYRGKVIFYSLCNFAVDLSATPELLASKKHQEIQTLNPTWEPDPEYPTYYLPPDSRKTIVVKAEIAGGALQRVSFVPTVINKSSQAEVLASSDDRFAEVVAYMEEITKDQDLNGVYAVDGDEVVVRPLP